MINKREKKLSIFNNSMPNYSKFKYGNQVQNAKNEVKSKIQKKRASYMSDAFELGFQQTLSKKQKSQSKKRTYQTHGNLYLSPNRQSICSSNLKSLIENFSISEEKERYIENYIMNKDPEFEIVEQNSIFDAFKSYIDER